MFDLTALPAEIVDRIFSLVPDPSEDLSRPSPALLADMRNLCLTSPTCYEFAVARLYSRVHLPRPRTGGLIAKAFSERPELAALVSQVTFGASEERLEGSRRTSCRQRWAAREIQRRSDIDPDVYTFATLPSLETLSIRIPGCNRLFRFLSMPARQASHLGPASASRPSADDEGGKIHTGLFPKLRELHIDPESPFTYKELLPTVSLPSLRSLHVHNLDAPRQPKEFSLGSSGLWHLHLHRCLANEAELGRILRSYRALKTLEYNRQQAFWGDVGNEDEDYGFVLGPKLVEGLASSRPSLTSLLVSGVRPPPENARSFGSLLDFKALRHIRAPTLLLLDTSEGGSRQRLVETLPLGLESLHTVSDGLPAEGALLIELLELVQSKDHADCLRRMTVQHLGRGLPAWGEPQGELLPAFHANDWALLKAACATAGIHLHVKMPGRPKEDIVSCEPLS